LFRGATIKSIVPRLPPYPRSPAPARKTSAAGPDAGPGSQSSLRARSTSPDRFSADRCVGAGNGKPGHGDLLIPPVSGKLTIRTTPYGCCSISLELNTWSRSNAISCRMLLDLTCMLTSRDISVKTLHDLQIVGRLETPLSRSVMLTAYHDFCTRLDELSICLTV